MSEAGGTNDLVRVEEADGVVTLTLNRPESANALSQALLQALHGAVYDLHFRPDVRAVILTGAGSKAFCAGADLKERRGMPEVQVRQAVARIRSVVESIAALPMPTIAAVNGVAFGGGTELALACDLRIAAASAKMGLTETGLAIIPGAGGTQRLPRLIGLAKAKELIYTARRIDAQTALAIGLVNQVAADDELLPAARALAAEIAQNGPVAVRQAKFAIDKGFDVGLEAGLAIEGKAYELVIPTEDRVEALQAFAEKRKPVFKGR
ncbi:enoyl-CoA hydratase [Alicyclobacillus cycloheptanicus]|uniref:Enoyl-CoA hydratase/carnithine racemase n=1 Tax=Alicyclobacillus cycloheptanicus TaxID=1457 RepID=A0ABT9XLU0_9BACL|nr:enoyl-CoA hydratase [Alicyclobacillus cycloheptanicus]MDQ0191250.1 enoyl-CoA hydratase/carnithine racemase [Alicyclobacillus cycloheptanicus]WDM01516.1 enoyl-CoA hydratase [Alicyclobacillus cycloheptanicus]